MTINEVFDIRKVFMFHSEMDLTETYNKIEDCEEYIYEMDLWEYHCLFKWAEDPEISPCSVVEVMVKE